RKTNFPLGPTGVHRGKPVIHNPGVYLPPAVPSPGTEEHVRSWTLLALTSILPLMRKTSTRFSRYVPLATGGAAHLKLAHAFSARIQSAWHWQVRRERPSCRTDSTAPRKSRRPSLLRRRGR